MVTKNDENCNKCIWGLENKCNDYFDCRGCPNRNEQCNCTKIKEGDVCPYFRLAGSHITYISYATTPEEFKSEIEEIIELTGESKENCHRHMDNLMCRVLTELGYGESIVLFKNQPKWYA